MWALSKIWSMQGNVQKYDVLLKNVGYLFILLLIVVLFSENNWVIGTDYCQYFYANIWLWNQTQLVKRWKKTRSRGAETHLHKAEVMALQNEKMILLCQTSIKFVFHVWKPGSIKLQRRQAKVPRSSNSNILKAYLPIFCLSRPQSCKMSEHTSSGEDRQNW